jgi:hypothetical protein
MKFLATGQQRASRVISQSSNMAGKGHTQMRSALEPSHGWKLCRVFGLQVHMRHMG